ncbi:MAG: ISAs1 family transposase [Isosphaeraceae bacterium]
MRVASEVGKGHGRREKRLLLATTWLNDYLDWPGVAQVFLLRRERTVGHETTVEEVFGVTSLSPQEASAAQLLAWVRRHWSIENQLFGVRDVTLAEDACRVRKGAAAEVLGGLRNAVVHLLSGTGLPSRAAALRHFMVHPLEALALMTTTRRE